MKNLNLGLHVNPNDLSLIFEARQKGYTSVQMFTGSPQTFSVGSAFVSVLKKYSKDINIYAHGPFVVNITNSKHRTYRKSIDYIKEVLKLGSLGLKGLVIHVGNPLTADELKSGSLLDLSSVKSSMLEALRELLPVANLYGCTLLLENMAGNKVGTCVSSVEFLCNLIAEVGKSDLKLCYDCVHRNSRISTTAGKINISKLFSMSNAGESLPRVLCYDEKKQSVVEGAITSVSRRLVRKGELLYKLKTPRSVLNCTAQHKILTDGGWSVVKDLEDEGNAYLYRSDSEFLSLESYYIESKEVCEETYLYDMTVRTYHNYICQGVVAHNSVHAFARGELRVSDLEALEKIKQYVGLIHLNSCSKGVEFGNNLDRHTDVTLSDCSQIKIADNLKFIRRFKDVDKICEVDPYLMIKNEELTVILTDLSDSENE